MLDADHQLNCFNKVNRLRSEARRQALDQQSVRSRLEQLMKEFGQAALSVAQGFLKRDDGSVSESFRNAVRILSRD